MLYLPRPLALTTLSPLQAVTHTEQSHLTKLKNSFVHAVKCVRGDKTCSPAEIRNYRIGATVTALVASLMTGRFL